MILKTNSTNPESLRKEVVEFLIKKNRQREASNFNQMVYTSVNLNAKSGSFNRDLSAMQVRDLAKLYGVKVVGEE